MRTYQLAWRVGAGVCWAIACGESPETGSSAPATSGQTVPTQTPSQDASGHSGSSAADNSALTSAGRVAAGDMAGSAGDDARVRGVAGTAAASGAATPGANSGAGATTMSGTGGTSGTSGTGGVPPSAAEAGTGGVGSVAGQSSAGQSANSADCSFDDPPANIAAWVDESWDAQLGQNIKSRQAWNVDNVMLNKGEMNLCVRWGATTAVPAEVHMNLASTVERWFNDWFKGLAGYGCFPYPDGIKVKVTGWAVRPGQESLLNGVDPAIPVYTELDGEGEPKCPDACSSFVHWDHDFSQCAKGEAWHSDYWLWFDDNLPGGGGAAAVGGDWGLRMPVRTFLGAFGKPSDHIVEHEMGHGFGFQDYYDWRGSKPEGGSIMIVGSTQSDAPTDADHWLLKRTWKEMKQMRSW